MAKIVPKIRFKGFTKEWSKKKLEEETSKIGDGLHGTPQYINNGDAYFINGNNLESGHIEITNDTKKVALSQLSENDKSFNLNTLFISINGTIGNIAKYKGEKIMLGKSVAFLNFLDNINNEFVFGLLQTPLIQNHFFKNLTGSTIKNLGLKAIRETEFISPANKIEQQKIGNFFKTLDKLITAHQQKHFKLQSFKKAMLGKMFPKEGQTMPDIRYKGFRGKWEKKELKDLGTFRSNGVDKKITSKEMSVNLLNYMDIYNFRKINARNCNQLMQVTAKPDQIIENNVLANDIFFTPSSETPDDIGKVMVIEEDLPNTVYSYHLMRFRPKKNVFYSIYPNYGFACEVVRKQLILLAQGVQRYVLNKPSFEQITILLPSIEEQQKIGDYFQNLDNMIRNHQIQIEKLKNIKKACLAKMFI